MIAGVLGACTLPYEQLSTPTPVQTATLPDQAHTRTTRTGIPLASPAAEETTGPRVYSGSDDFTSSRSTRVGRAPDGIIEPAWKPNVAQSGGGQPGAGSGAGGAAAGRDGITINLVGAPVVEVAKTVLGDVLGVNYIVSDKVKANITMRTVRPVDKAGLLEIFEAVLRAEGAALVVEGGVYKIIPAADAAGSGAPLRQGRGRAGVGVITDIVPLRYVAAPEMERLIKSVAPQASVLRSDPVRNVLVVSGSQAELAQMHDLINVFDVDSMRGMSFGLFPVEASDPDAVAQELDVIFANDREGPTKGIVRFLGNKRLKTVFVITPRREYIRKAATWIERLDKASQATEKRVHVYHVQNRPAAEMAALVQKVYGIRSGDQGRQGGGGSSSGSDVTRTQADGSSGIGSSGIGGSGTGGGSIGVQPPTISGAPQPSVGGSSGAGEPRPPGVGVGPIGGDTATGAPSAETAKAASGFGAGLPPDDRHSGISVVADESNNSLVITATLAEYKRMLRTLQTLDSAPVQVLLEGTIAEVRLNDELKFGVRWFFQNKAKAESFGFTDASATIASALGGFSYFLNAASAKVLVNALGTVTDVNILSTPTLMVVENKKAILQVGDEVPILTQQAAPLTGATPTSTIVNSVTYRNTGVILNITPRVGSDGRVLLEIEQEVSEVTSATTSGIQSPTIQQRRVKTIVTVRDGQTVVLAGLMRDKATKQRDQVPLLGDIPYLGQAFKSKDDTIDRTELLIAITPQVIRDDSQIAAVTTELRDSINFSTRPQRGTPPDHREQADRLWR